jgi:hypothetical protein
MAIHLSQPYKEAFPVGSSVRVADLAVLEEFKAGWRYHHALKEEQLAFAGAPAIVREVSYYHGGDVLYYLDPIPGTWHEACVVAG